MRALPMVAHDEVVLRLTGVRSAHGCSDEAQLAVKVEEEQTAVRYVGGRTYGATRDHSANRA